MLAKTAFRNCTRRYAEILLLRLMVYDWRRESKRRPKLPRGGPRQGAGRKRKPLDGAAVTAEQSRLPLSYLLTVLADESADPQRRDRAALALLPFFVLKPDGLGRRDPAIDPREDPFWPGFNG
jgi:hypothetical protein